MPGFSLTHTDAATNARAGVLATAHGEVKTPVFMPVGTQGTVKAVDRHALSNEIGADIILGNTYHLYLRPGTEVLRGAGGLHQFANWSGALLTDSGGFQVFSLADRRRISEDGVQFQSHLDGSRHDFTPESVIDIQRTIGADVIMVLDECPAGDVSEEYARQSNQLTIRWAKRCLEAWRSQPPLYGFEQQLFGIVQGVVYADVRRESAHALVDLDFPGYAIGGLSVGEPAEQMYAMVEVCNEILPREKPRYLMGVGTPENLLENVARGVDMFDCVMPTRNARNGMLFTTSGVINIRNKKWEHDHSPIDPGLDTDTSQGYSRSYLRHLIMSKEVLGLQIASTQNLALYAWLMSEARRNIVSGTFSGWKGEIQPQVSQRL